MLRCVFVGQKSGFNEFFADWLSARTDLCHILWTDQDRFSWAWRWKWLRRSYRKHRLVGTVDRLAFRLWMMRSREADFGWRQLLRDIRSHDSLVGCSKEVPRTLIDSTINSEATKRLLHDIQPDILLVNCMSQIIEKNVLEIPRLGTFIYHEGLTPEYRGVHTTIWAIANGDDDKVGFTLLKANAKLDAGEVYAQGSTTLDPLATPIGYIGHWALFEGFPEVERVLQDLAEGTAQPIDTSKRQSGYYSYFPFTGWWRVRKRRRERGIPEQVLEGRNLHDEKRQTLDRNLGVQRPAPLTTKIGGSAEAKRSVTPSMRDGQKSMK